MELQEYVGKFVKVGEHYGMIDNVFGSRLGFVWSVKESWTGQLVDVEDVQCLTKAEDVQVARLSAKNYMLRERASLKARIARKLECDSHQRLQELLDFVSAWVSRIE